MKKAIEKISKEQLLERLQNGTINKFTINGNIFVKKSKEDTANQNVINIISMLNQNRDIDTQSIRFLYLDLKRYLNSPNVSQPLKFFIRQFIQDYQDRFSIAELE